MDLDRKKNGVPKKREAPPDGWTSSMEYAFVYAKKIGQIRYVYRGAGEWFITDDEPHTFPYWTVDPLGDWREVSLGGRLHLPTLRK